MAFKEIFELGSLLHGDDQEKAELDRQITSITSNIKQQEGRCLHEMGELRRLEDEVEGVEHNFDRVNSTLNFLEAKVNNLDQEARSINNIDLMQRLQSFCINRNEFIGDLKIIEIKLDALDLQITEASELQSGKLVEQSSMMYIRAKDDNVNLNEKDIIIEKLQEEMQNLDVQLKHCVQESDKLIEQQHQLESRTFELNRTSYSLKESLVQIRDKSTKLIPAIIEQAEIYSHSLSDKQAQLRKVEEAHKIQQDEIDAIHDDVHSNRTKNDNLESQLNNYLKIWREIDQKRIDKRNELEIKRASANQTQLELTQLEQELYLLQAQSIKDQPYNLVDTVEFLSFETEMIRSTLVEMQESTKEINDQVKLARPNSQLSSVLQQIEENLTRKEVLLQSLDELSSHLVQENKNFENLSAKLKKVPIDHSAIQKSIEESKDFVNSIRSEIVDLKQQTTAQDTGNLAAAIEKKLAYIEDRNNKLIKSLQVNADLEQEIRESAEQVKLLAKERQILVDSKKSALKSKEKMRRIETLKKEKIAWNKEQFANMEKELMEEDSKFKEILILAERRLARKKDILMKELEKIIEDTKMVHKSGKEEAKLSPIQNQVENFQEETYTDYAQSFDAPEFIDEGKSLKNVEPRKVGEKRTFGKMTKSVLTPSIKEPASLLKKRIGSLSLNPADNQRNDENAKAEEAPITFQSMKKPKARMRSALSSKNPNII